MQIKLFKYLMLIIIISVTSCGNVTYEYGKKHENGRKIYDGNIDTTTYNHYDFFGVTQMIRRDTCFTYDKKGKILSTSIASGYYLDPNFIYVMILEGNFKHDKNGDFVIYLKEDDDQMRKMKFSYNIKGPVPIFKVRKTTSTLKLCYKKDRYEIDVDSNYIFLYLFAKNNKLRCNYTDEPIISR